MAFEVCLSAWSSEGWTRIIEAAMGWVVFAVPGAFIVGKR